MIKKLLLLIICLSLNILKGQDESISFPVLPSDIPTHNLLKYNRFYFNPTFSFVRQDKKYVNAYTRIQWSGFEDHPQTYLINYNGNFDERMGLGLSLHQQNEGILRYFGALANYSYNLQLNDNMNFAFGLNLGFAQSGVKRNLKINGDPIDQPINLAFENSSSLQLTPGINFNFSDFDIGVSAINLVVYNLSGSELLTDNMAFNGHVMYTTTFGDRRSEKTIRAMGYANMVPDMTTTDGGLALRYGANVLVELPKLGWAQGGYHSFYGATLGLGGNIGDNVSIGYNYEMGLGDTSNQGATHEITFAYNFAEERKAKKGSRNNSTKQKAYEQRDSEIRRLKKEILDLNKLLRENKTVSTDSASRAQKSLSRLERQIEEAKEEESQRARQLALKRENDIKLLNKKKEEGRVRSQRTLEMEMAEKKAEEERLASKKKLEMEMREDRSQQEAQIAAEEAEREAIAARQQEEEERKEAAARLAEENRKKAAAAEAARLAEENRKKAAAAEAARLAEEERKRKEAENEESVEALKRELDNSSRVSSRIIRRRDSLLNASLNVDKRGFNQLLESLVNMGSDAKDAKQDEGVTSAKRLEAKNRFIKFAESSRPTAKIATKFIPGYPEGYYLIGNVFKGGVYAEKFTGKLKDLGFNSQIIKNPENGLEYAAIENYSDKDEAARKYLNNIDDRYFGEMWILHIAKSKVSSYKKLLQETRLVTETVKDDTVVTENLSYIGGHQIENGYYLIASIFKRENYFQRGMERLKAKGLNPQFFRNPKDNYIYVYLKKFDKLEDAKQSLFSNVNNTYDGDLYILRIQ